MDYRGRKGVIDRLWESIHPRLTTPMAWRLRQVSCAVWTEIASARSSDKGLCSLGHDLPERLPTRWNPPEIIRTVAWQLRQIRSAVWTGIASARSSDKGLCSLGMISLSDYRLDGYLTSKYYLPTGRISARRQDCKNEIYGCFPGDLCVS